VSNDNFHDAMSSQTDYQPPLTGPQARTDPQTASMPVAAVIRDRIPVLAWLTATALTTAALIPAIMVHRVLYADGAYYLYLLLTTPNKFMAIYFGRVVSLHVMEAPVLLGELLSVNSISSMARLFHLGVFGVPAALFLAALWLVRRDVRLFAITASAFAVFSFCVSFLNTETNYYFAMCWLAATTLALPEDRPAMRGALLPVLAALCISAHEAAVFSAPVLAIWSTMRAMRTDSSFETAGLSMAALLFWIAAGIALVAGLAPRDVENASGFLSSIPKLLNAPPRWLLATAILVPCATLFAGRNVRIALVAISIVSGLLYVRAIAHVAGYYGFSFYYANRAGLTILIVPALAILAWASRKQPGESGGKRRTSNYFLALVPLVFAVSGDLVGSFRWNNYVNAFCEVLAADMEPQARLKALEASGHATGWVWTHPTLSILLRARDSSAFVTNGPGRWEPPEVRAENRLNRPGICPDPHAQP
jgi:hypothetical protein